MGKIRALKTVSSLHRRCKLPQSVNLKNEGRITIWFLDAIKVKMYPIYLQMELVEVDYCESGWLHIHALDWIQRELF